MKKEKYAGKFIVFEGLDGSGQSTQAELLKKYVEKTEDISVLLTKEPTSAPPIGTLIRKILKKEFTIGHEAFQLLFCADRSEHLKNAIEPAFERGDWVISDRYFYSSIAYGSMDIPIERVIELNAPFLRPDIVFLIKVSPKTCLDRIDKNRGEREFFEEEEKLAKVWKNYEALAERFPEINIIDGEKSIEEVSAQIKAKMTG